jgi:hypothetical protein
MMKISFPLETPAYCEADPALAFPAVVNGIRLECSITAEALEDHFGAASIRAEDLQNAFRAHAHTIHVAARRILTELGAMPVALHSGYFRFSE